MKAFISIFFKTRLSLLGLVFIGACAKTADPVAEGIEVGQALTVSEDILLTELQFKTMNMSWGNPQLGEFSSEINVQGSVKVPVEGMQEISAYFGGYVSDLTLIEGQVVRKGQTLFYLENPEYIRLQQDYLEISSQLDYLKAEYERQKTLYGEEISSQKNFLKAEAEYRTAMAKSQSLKKQLALIQIDTNHLTPESIRSKIPVLSPINGFVEEVLVAPGQYLPASGKALSLLNRDHLHLELVLFQKDASRVHVGQLVEITTPDSPGEVLKAKVHVVAQTINSQRQINVHADLVNEKEGSKLIPGMYVQAGIQLDPQPSLAVPEEALIEVDGDYYVLVQKEKTPEGFLLNRVKVIPGARNKNLVAIESTEELNEESVILTKGGFNLL